MSNRGARTVDLQSPYSPPDALDSAVAPSIMFWIAGCIFASMAIGALFGLVLGVVIVQFFPGYYRAVFNAGDNPVFDPLSVGIGLGVTQGTAAGAVVGFLSVITYFWIRTRKSPQDRI
jgi:hypothetical protein